MADVINTNVFDSTKKFVDFTGLDYFWEKAKAYVDGVDTTMTARIKTNEDAITAINLELESLNGGVGSVGTQINEAIAALNLPTTYEAKGAAATALTDAKAYADGLATNYDAAGAATTALTDAKAYADGLATNYDAAGAAAGALTDAKAYADGLVSPVAADVAALKAIDHQGLIDAAINDFATKVSDDQVINSYKELIDYAAEHGAEFTNLVGVVDAKADKTYVDGLASNYDAAGSAATALTDAKAYADGLASNYDAAGSAATALTDAKAYADGLASNYDAAGAAATALTDAKAYADGLNTTMTQTVNAAVEAAKNAAIADADAKLALKANADSVYTKTAVDAKFTENSAADQAYAKTYTDQLFSSFTFAGTTDIDSMFA